MLPTVGTNRLTILVDHSYHHPHTSIAECTCAFQQAAHRPRLLAPTRTYSESLLFQVACAKLPPGVIGRARDSAGAIPKKKKKAKKAHHYGYSWRCRIADRGMRAWVEQMKQALQAAKNNKAAQAAKFEIYPEAPHAFHADYRATYREGPAKDGWDKCLAWLKQQGVV